MSAQNSSAKLQKVSEIDEESKKNFETAKKPFGIIRFFRTESGEAYGFTIGGKIYLDPRIATAEIPIHEYTHLWAEVLIQANPKAWEQLKSELAKDTELTDTTNHDWNIRIDGLVKHAI